MKMRSQRALISRLTDTLTAFRLWKNDDLLSRTSSSSSSSREHSRSRRRLSLQRFIFVCSCWLPEFYISRARFSHHEKRMFRARGKLPTNTCDWHWKFTSANCIMQEVNRRDETRVYYIHIVNIYVYISVHTLVTNIAKRSDYVHIRIETDTMQHLPRLIGKTCIIHAQRKAQTHPPIVHSAHIRVRYRTSQSKVLTI